MSHLYRVPVLITAPTVEPVTLAEAKSWVGLSLLDASMDTRLNEAIVTARDSFERETDSQVMTATWELRLDAFPLVIRLPKGPIVSVTSVKYVDTTGTTITLDTDKYESDFESEPARVQPVDGEVWPSTKPGLNKVQVRYVSGYATAVLVPQTIKAAIKMSVVSLFDHPGAQEQMKLSENAEYGRMVAQHRASRIG